MKIKVQARNLLPGDVTGNSEVVRSIISSPRVPRGYGPHRADKVEVILNKCDGRLARSTPWGAYTEINVERAEV